MKDFRLVHGGVGSVSLDSASWELVVSGSLQCWLGKLVAGDEGTRGTKAGDIAVLLDLLRR